MNTTALSKLIRFSLLLAVILITDGALSHPFNGEKHPKTPAKIMLPDYFDAAETAKAPMVANNNFDMIMPDYYDNHPAASIRYQNFLDFYDPQMIGNNEYNMEETRYVQTNRARTPQPLSAEERRARQRLEEIDEKREKKQLLKLKKGSAKPRVGATQWDQFDYDAYSGSPAKKHKKPYFR